MAVTGGTGTYAGATGSIPVTGSVAGTFPSVTLSFTGSGTITTGGSGGPPGPAGPTITAVLDGASYSKNIAQGSVFIVKGSSLSTTGFNQAGFPLPTILNNSKITFTPLTGGAGTDAFMVYTCNTSQYGCVNDKTQLAAVLPSTLPTGTYNVTVTSSGAVSAPFLVQVVQRKFTLITRDSSGSGLAVVQNFTSATAYTIDALTSSVSGLGPLHPGSVLVIWGTGLGPVTTGDNTASPGVDFRAANTIRVIVGGTTINPDYAGRAPGLAGADQINFTLPANVQTGCTVSLQVSVNGDLSNPTYISIAPAGADACVLPGYTTAQLQKFDQGGTFTVGSFNISELSENLPGVGSFKNDSAGGSFTQYSAFQLSGVPPATTGNTSGACTVFHFTGSQSQLGIGGGGKALDAGTITLNGPAGSNISNKALTQDASNNYSLQISGIGGFGGIGGSIVAGTYTLAGAGGTDVNSFNTSISLGTPLNITGGLPSNVVRASGLPLSWTGGNSSDLVQIYGFAGTSSGTGANATLDGTQFTCITTAGTGGFTVPSDILLQLPAVSAASIAAGTGATLLSVSSGPPPSSFTASLKAGGSIDSGTFAALIGTGTFPTYQ
jgi:uncharacterized protein (TIGR03437 family)